MFFRFILYMQRMRMIAYAVLTIAFAVLAVLPVTMLWRDNAWHFVRATDPRAIALFWQQGTGNLIATLTVVLAFCAADLGVTALGDEGGQRSLEWVVTRPRPRLGLAWGGWAAAAVNCVLLVVSGLVTMAIVLGASTRVLDFAHIGMAALALAVASLTMMSVAFALSAGVGSVRNGYLLALFVVIFFGILRYGYFNIVMGRYIPLWAMSANNLYRANLSAQVAVSTLAAALLMSAGGAAMFARRDV